MITSGRAVTEEKIEKASASRSRIDNEGRTGSTVIRRGIICSGRIESWRYHDRESTKTAEHGSYEKRKERKREKRKKKPWKKAEVFTFEVSILKF
jgi:hypothetical protein